MNERKIGRPQKPDSLLTTHGSAVYALCQRPQGCIGLDVAQALGAEGKNAADLLRLLWRTGRVTRDEKHEGRWGYRYRANPAESWEAADARSKASARARFLASVAESRERMAVAMKGSKTAHTVPVTQKVVGGVLITRAATPPDRFEVRQAPRVFRDIRGVPGRSWVESYLGSRA